MGTEAGPLIGIGGYGNREETVKCGHCTRYMDAISVTDRTLYLVFYQLQLVEREDFYLLIKLIVFISELTKPVPIKYSYVHASCGEEVDGWMAGWLTGGGGNTRGSGEQVF